MKKILSLILALTMMLSLLTACGSGQSKEPAPSEDPAQSEEAAEPAQEEPAAAEPAEAAAETATGEPIKFAFVAPLTGDASQYGLEQRAGMELAVKYINEQGGVNGHPLEYDVYDCKNDPKEVVEIARMIGENDEYLWVQGTFSSACCMAAAPIYEEYGIVQMSSSASASAWCPMNDYQFMGGSTQYADAEFVVKYAIQKYMGYGNIAIIHHNSESGMSALDNLKLVAGECGVNIADTEAIAVGEADFSAILSKLRQTDIEAIVIAANYTEATNCIKQARDMGWDIPFMLTASSASDQIVEILGDKATNVYANENFNRAMYEDPQYTQLLSDFEDICGWTMTMFGALAYDTCGVLANAAERCGDHLTRENFRDQLAATTADDFNGICGPIEFNEDGSLDRVYIIIEAEDGAWVSKTTYDFVNE